MLKLLKVLNYAVYIGHKKTFMARFVGLMSRHKDVSKDCNHIHFFKKVQIFLNNRFMLYS